MDTVTIIALLLFTAAAGFVLGCAWAGRQREDSAPAFQKAIDSDPETPWSATAQIAAMDGDRVRDRQRRDAGRRADIETVIWIQNPHLKLRQVQALAARRLQERGA